MVIADIDQDFFYKHVGASVDGPSQVCSRNDLKKCMDFNTLYNKYNLVTAKGFRIFNNHDEVYYELKRMGTTGHNMLHFDRHDDVGLSTNSQDMPVNIGNFISHLALEEIIVTNEWITLNNVEEEDNILIYDCPYKISKYENHTTDLRVDYVYFTLSEEFCADNSILLDFINVMNRKNVANSDERFI